MKTYQTTHPNHPKGATSLLVVTGMALVFIAIITGLTALSIRQSQQALDTDLSNRALAAAESGAQDAAQRLRTDPSEEYPSCSGKSASVTFQSQSDQKFQDATRPVLSRATDNDTSIICRTVTSSGTQIDGQILKDSDTQINMTVDTVQSIILSYNQPTADSTNAQPPQNVTVYPSSAAYGRSPATLELTMIYWPKSLAGISPSGMQAKTIVLLPDQADKSPINSNKLQSKCVASGEYTCSTTINVKNNFGIDPAQFNAVFRIKARYADTHFLAKFYQASTVNTNDTPNARVKNSKAVIDVTAKVGNLYRRIKAELPLQDLSWLDSVLYTNKGICKNLKVYDDHTADSYTGNGRNNCNLPEQE